MLPPITVRPAIKATRSDAGQEIRHQIVAQIVPFIYRGPEHFAAGRVSHALRVAETAGIYPHTRAVRVDLQDIRPVLFQDDAVFPGITARAHGHEYLFTVFRNEQVTRPVVVITARWQAQYLPAAGGAMCLPGLIRINHDAIGI